MGRINIMKMAILPKAIFRFDALPIKSKTQYFTDLKITIFTFICKSKKPRISKMILNNKRISGDVNISDFKLYYRAIVVKNDIVLV